MFVWSSKKKWYFHQTLLLILLVRLKGLVKVPKDGFFSEIAIRFLNLTKKIFQKTILTLKFKIPAHNSSMLWVGILNFKFRIVFWNIFFGDWEIWKTNYTFWKNPTFRIIELGRKTFMSIQTLVLHRVTDTVPNS